MRRNFLIFIAFFIFANFVSSQKTYLRGLGDTLFFPAKTDSVFLLQPVYGDFSQMDALMPLCYVRDTVFQGKFLSAAQLGIGTYFLAVGNLETDTICSVIPIFEKHPQVWQITVRRDSSFIGFCEELLGLPFVLPPRKIPGYGHQTDLRLAADCAELAIYARRRQGHKIPYVGPRGLWKYLRPAEKLEPGVILHFGHQVSVLYEDRGRSGVLDEDDLLIHSYREMVEILPLGETNLQHRSCRIMRWKE